jgi:hypothetical protein
MLRGVVSLECGVVKIANQGVGLLFTSAMKIPKLACCSCSIPWVKPLLGFAIVEEGSLIYNFAVQWKARFSSKIWRKLCLKLHQRIAKALERRSALCRDVVRGHVGKPPYASYTRRARMARCRSDRSSPVPSVASGPR